MHRQRRSSEHLSGPAQESPSSERKAPTHTCANAGRDTCTDLVKLLLQIITPLLGRYNVYNVLAAVAVGIALDLSLHVRSTTLALRPLPSINL